MSKYIMYLIIIVFIDAIISYILLRYKTKKLLLNKKSFLKVSSYNKKRFIPFIIILTLYFLVQVFIEQNIYSVDHIYFILYLVIYFNILSLNNKLIFINDGFVWNGKLMYYVDVLGIKLKKYKKDELILKMECNNNIDIEVLVSEEQEKIIMDILNLTVPLQPTLE